MHSVPSDFRCRYVSYPQGPASTAKLRSRGRPSFRTSLVSASGVLAMAPWARTSPSRPNSATATAMESLASSRPTNKLDFLMTDPPYVALRHGWYPQPQRNPRFADGSVNP